MYEAASLILVAFLLISFFIFAFQLFIRRKVPDDWFKAGFNYISGAVFIILGVLFGSSIPDYFKLDEPIFTLLFMLGGIGLSVLLYSGYVKLIDRMINKLEEKENKKVG